MIKDILLFSPFLRPSPQIVLQVETFNESPLFHWNPASIIHEELHPSKLFRFPSSHCSYGVIRIPSPQIVKQESGDTVFPPLQSQPDSTTH